MQLADIATQQQLIAAKKIQVAGSVGSEHLNVSSRVLRMGKYSDASSPLSAPWVVQPESAIPFASNGTINTPAIGSGWTDVIGPAGQYPMQVPNGFDGVIKTAVNFYNGGGFVSGSGSLIWRLLQNGAAVRNFDNILIQFGVMPFPSTIEGVRVKSNDTIQFQVNNISLAGAGTQIVCYLGGYHYSNKLS